MTAIIQTIDTPDGAFTILVDDRQRVLSSGWTAEVDAIVAKAGAAGGKAEPTPTQDHGFMYGSSFEDPDGHIWEVMWMDVEAAAKASADSFAAA